MKKSSDLKQWAQQFITDVLGQANCTMVQHSTIPQLFDPNHHAVWILDAHQVSRLLTTYTAMVGSPLSHQLIKETPSKIHVGLHIKPLILEISKIFAATPEQSGTDEQQSLRRAQWLNTMRQVQSITPSVSSNAPTIDAVQSGQLFRQMMTDWARFCMEGPTLDLDEVERLASTLAQHMAHQWLDVANPNLEAWNPKQLACLHHLVEMVIPDAAGTRITDLHLENIHARLHGALTPIMRQALLADGLASLDVRTIHIDQSIIQMKKELAAIVWQKTPSWKSLWSNPPPHPDSNVVVNACVQHALKLSRHPSAPLTEVFATFRPKKHM